MRTGSMNKLQVIWAAFKAELVACLGVVLVGLLFWGFDQANLWLFVDACNASPFWYCGVARWWTMWWWAAVGIAFFPVHFSILTLAIRRFAAPGYRLATVGVLVVWGAMGWTESAMTWFSEAPKGETFPAALASGACLLLVALGAYWFFRPAPMREDSAAP